MEEPRLALIASTSPQAQQAADILREMYDFVPLEDANLTVALGGDGHILQTLHSMLENRRILPVFGMNKGTVGFLMNGWSSDNLLGRILAAKNFSVRPLVVQVVTVDGQKISMPAINELSLFRETRQAAKIIVDVDGRTVISELIGDGILVATPAGSTAYNLSANGPILPLESSMLALTAINPFRPRRWRGAILPDSNSIRLTVLEHGKRPVSAVADQREIRDVHTVEISLDRTRELKLLFDPDHALDERIAMEQFIT